MRRIVCLLVLFLSALLAYGQQVVTTAGSSGTGGGIRLNWTIGETLSETLRGSAVHLTQGFHQGKLVVVSAENEIEQANGIKVFPNPVSNSLHIGFGSNEFPDAQLLLFDAAGKRIFCKATSGQQVETIDMESFPPGTYLLHIQAVGPKVVKTVKVLKK
jgi:hypothetical protein